MDASFFEKFKSAQKETWVSFAPNEALTTIPAGKLVQFANVTHGENVLDACCGTGVVAITAARSGAKVRALDLTAELLERARWNAGVAGTAIDFVEGDVESLPYGDAEFDVVLSQFGHIFAPRPQKALAEMLRVLKPGGRIAFSTWPPDHYTGRMFALLASYMPPPEGIPAPSLWGNPQVIRERFGNAVANLEFENGIMINPALSPQHVVERGVGPLAKVLKKLEPEPALLEKFRVELESLIKIYSDGNALRQHFLMTRAVKVWPALSANKAGLLKQV